MPELPPPLKIDRQPPRRRKRSAVPWIVSGCAALGGAAAVVVVLLNQPAPIQEPPPEPPTVEVAPPAPVAAAPAKPRWIEDDGRTLWAPPQEQPQPIDLAWLPPDTQFAIQFRPAALARLNRLDGVVASLGPQAQAGAEWLAKSLGVPLAQFERVALAFRPGRDLAPQWGVVVELASQAQPILPAATPQVACFQPPDSRLVVIAPPEVLQEIQADGGAAPPLRRELEQLVAQLDGAAELWVWGAPNFLFLEGRLLLSGGRAPLRDPLAALFTEQGRGLGLVLDWEAERCVAEVRLAPSIGTPLPVEVQRLAKTIADLPGQIELAIASQSADPHGRKLIARLPAMLRVLDRYTRTSADHDHAVARAYLPAEAGENLLMAGELLLAEFAGGAPATIAAATPAPAGAPTKSLDERLKTPVSVAFSRDTLESAIRLLSDEMGAPITILGGDLQLEGITKNQSFGLDQVQQPAEAVLVEILRLANPDKTATGPADTKQKLVYVVRDGAIVVTTRSAAANRGESLPAVFAAGQ